MVNCNITDVIQTLLFISCRCVVIKEKGRLVVTISTEEGGWPKCYEIKEFKKNWK